MPETKAKLIRKKAVIDGYKQGMTIKQIEKKYGMSSATIRTYLREERKKAAEEEQKEQIKARSEAIKADISGGMTLKEAAEKENTSYTTVCDTLRAYRTQEVSPDILYKEIDMPGVRKQTMRNWAEQQAGRFINTPDGQMLVTAVYPHILECSRQIGNREFKTTYMHGEVFYINGR